MYRFEIDRMVDAPAEVVWEVISDVGGYHKYAPNLSKSEVLEGEGVGLRRRCHDTRGRGWNEQCVLWREGQLYSIAVDTSDYPYPFTKMQGTWGLEERPDSVLVKMRFDYAPKYDPPVIGWLADRLMIKRAMKTICQELMDNWVAEIKERTRQRQRA